MPSEIKAPAGALKYMNRAGAAYYLFRKKTRTGQDTYYLSARPKPNADPVGALPEGYEIYEHPDDAQVFLRKPIVSAITELEREAVNAAMLKQMPSFAVDLSKDALTIYIPNRDMESPEDLAREFGVSLMRARDHLARSLLRSRYSKMMRFTLGDKKQRHFSVERWCFRGSIDDWIYLDGDKPLAALLKKYIKHLGQESFFDLC